MFRQSNHRGFTLIEIMIVVVIVGIMAALAVPAYNDSVRKSRRADAEQSLTEQVNRLEVQFGRNMTYVGATLRGGGVTTQSREGYYTINLITAGPNAVGVNNYTLQATPNGTQALDRVRIFQIDSTGVKQHSIDGINFVNGWNAP